jgi:hypothetical protein
VTSEGTRAKESCDERRDASDGDWMHAVTSEGTRAKETGCML